VDSIGISKLATIDYITMIAYMDKLNLSKSEMESFVEKNINISKQSGK